MPAGIGKFGEGYYHDISTGTRREYPEYPRVQKMVRVTKRMYVLFLALQFVAAA